MVHEMHAGTHVVYARPIFFSDCYGDNVDSGDDGNDGDRYEPVIELSSTVTEAPSTVIELWAEAPTTEVTEQEMALLWCHKDMNSPSWWTNAAYMAAEQ